MFCPHCHQKLFNYPEECPFCKRKIDMTNSNVADSDNTGGFWAWFFSFFDGNNSTIDSGGFFSDGGGFGDCGGGDGGSC